MKKTAKNRNKMKKTTKIFGTMKNICTFVMLYAKRHKQKEQEVFFYAKDTGYQTPLTNYLSSICSCCLATTEGDSLFYIKNFKNLIH